MVVDDFDDLEESDFRIPEKTLRQESKPHELFGNGRTMHYRKAPDGHRPERPRRVNSNPEGVLCQKISRS
jgi:hypothetical protein